jgi:haloalkane dehalogenase
VSLLPDDLDANGNPIKPLEEIPNFWALDLRQWQRWRGAPTSFGWPWVGDVPASGTCPPSWRPAFAYDTTRYPFTNRCVPLRFGTYHYFDETPEDAKGTVLMVHGNPTWSFVYRALAEGLYAAGYRVIAMDYYGYGLSARPDPESFDYMAHDHADSLEEFVQALDLTDLTLVLQDWGGPLGLGMGGHLPSRIKDLVLMNTWAWNVYEDHPGVNHAMVRWSLLNRRNAEMFISTGSFPRGVGNSLGALYGPPGSPEYLAVRNAYWGPFLNLSTGQPLSRAIVRPTNQMAQDLLLDRDFLEETDRNLQALSHKPLYLLFGRLDGNFGALRCDADAMPPCPLGAACRSMPGGAFCLRPDGAFVYPYVDGFRERWAADKIIEVSIRPTATHFIQEQEVDAIVAAVKRLYHGFN